MSESNSIREVFELLREAFSYVKGFPLFIFALAYVLILLLIVSLGTIEIVDKFVYLLYCLPMWVIVVYVMETRVYRIKQLSEREALKAFLQTENLLALEKKASTYGWSVEQLVQIILLKYIKENCR